MKDGLLATGAILALAVAPGQVVAQMATEALLSAMVGHESAPVGDGRMNGFIMGFGLREGPFVFGPEFLFQDGDSLRLRAFGLTLKLRQREGWIHPHLVLGVGAYAWKHRVAASPELFVDGPTRVWRETSYVSASLGGGLTLGSVVRGVGAVFEARWHRNLEQNRAAGSRSLIAASAGLRVAW